MRLFSIWVNSTYAYYFGFPMQKNTSFCDKPQIDLGFALLKLIFSKIHMKKSNRSQPALVFLIASHIREFVDLQFKRKRKKENAFYLIIDVWGRFRKIAYQVCFLSHVFNKSRQIFQKISSVNIVPVTNCAVTGPTTVKMGFSLKIIWHTF